MLIVGDVHVVCREVYSLIMGGVTKRAEDMRMRG